MVKRQTVWLSTMMVLSLMLIGYYTMNNQSSTPTSTPSTPSASTTSSDGSATSGSGTNANSSAGTTAQTTSSTSPSDWFASTKLTVDQQISQQIDRLKTEMANNNASSSQIAEASGQLNQVMTLSAGLDSASEAIKADGYQNAVIIPDDKDQTFTVYVQSNNIAKSDALKVMTIASQQLDTSMLNILVKAHS